MNEVVVPDGVAVAVIMVVLAVMTGSIVFLVRFVFKDVREFWKYCPIKGVVIPTLVLVIPAVYVVTIMTAVELFRSLGA